MSEFIKAITSADFEQEVIVRSQQVPVLVDFWADWCEPCKQLMPVLYSIVDSLDGTVCLATIDTDKEQELAIQLGIRSLPTVVLFKNGEMVEQFTGVKSESEIRQLLAIHLDEIKSQEPQVVSENISEDMQKAIGYINQGQLQQAIPHLKNDSSLTAKLLLVKVYLQAGEVENAVESFNQLDDEQKQDEQAKTIKITLNLIELGHKTSYIELQEAIEKTIAVDPQQGIEQLLQVLSQARGNDKDDSKKALIIAFNLIDDAKLVSQLRRKMAALIF